MAAVEDMVVGVVGGIMITEVVTEEEAHNHHLVTTEEATVEDIGMVVVEVVGTEGEFGEEVQEILMVGEDTEEGTIETIVRVIDGVVVVGGRSF